MYTKEQAEKAAASGAALLDEKEPGWWERTDPPSLQMGTMCGCILGQVYGSYGAAPPGLTGHCDPEHGFDLPEGLDGVAEEWDLLKAAWVAEINKRREAAGRDDPVGGIRGRHARRESHPDRGPAEVTAPRL